jgi:hypothetical protein
MNGMAVKDKNKERKIIRVPAKVAGGQKIGALRARHPGADPLLEALEGIRTEVKLNRPNELLLESLTHEMYVGMAERLHRTKEILETKGSAAALEEIRKSQEATNILTEEIKKETARRITELDQETKALHGTVNVDKTNTSNEDKDMSAITREEFDAKLESIEARMDGRVASIAGKLMPFSCALMREQSALRKRRKCLHYLETRRQQQRKALPNLRIAPAV